jgi:hypothetical protein
MSCEAHLAAPADITPLARSLKKHMLHPRPSARARARCRFQPLHIGNTLSTAILATTNGLNSVVGAFTPLPWQCLRAQWLVSCRATDSSSTSSFRPSCHASRPPGLIRTGRKGRASLNHSPAGERSLSYHRGHHSPPRDNVSTRSYDGSLYSSRFGQSPKESPGPPTPHERAISNPDALFRTSPTECGSRLQ